MGANSKCNPLNCQKSNQEDGTLYNLIVVCIGIKLGQCFRKFGQELETEFERSHKAHKHAKWMFACNWSTYHMTNSLLHIFQNTILQCIYNAIFFCILNISLTNMTHPLTLTSPVHWIGIILCLGSSWQKFHSSLFCNQEKQILFFTQCLTYCQLGHVVVSANCLAWPSSWILTRIWYVWL